MSQPHQGPPLNATEKEEMLGLWPVDPIRGEGVRTQDRGLIKDGTVYGEGACVRDCIESGVQTVERRSGETRVYGTRCEDVGMLR